MENRGDFCMTFRDIDLKGFWPVVLLFAQTQWVMWDPRAVCRKTQQLYFRDHGAHGGWLLLHQLMCNCRVGPAPWQGRKGEALSLPSCPKSAPRALEGLGTPAVGIACWLWRVVACQGLGFGMLQRHAPWGCCCLALSTPLSLSPELCCGFWYAEDAPPPAVSGAHTRQEQRNSWRPAVPLHCLILLLGKRWGKEVVVVFNITLYSQIHQI